LLRADAEHGAATVRHRDLVPRPFPQLHQRRGMAEELLARGRQAGAGLVAHEEASAKLILERADARADRRLADMQALRGADEAAGGNDGEEGANQFDVHAACLLTEIMN